ncbi:MAG: hypothetical protein HY908_33125 [Myxococcales bacterium]|nr:hypothetical protein [Myxococcales bacterium]
MPSAGSYYRVVGGVRVRRVLLARTRYAVYYSLDAEAEVVTVHSVWSTLRGRGPKL